MSIKVTEFFEILKKGEIEFFTGVPDSLLKEFCLYAYNKIDKKKHVVAANEGTAVAIASGNYLSTGKIPLVYLQNSGLGNTINPLLSLCSKNVYSIPMLILIGWRGEPGKIDEPQHLVQGKIQNELLKAIDVPYSILPKNISEAKKIMIDTLKSIGQKKCPHFIVVPKGVFENGKSLQNKYPQQNKFYRENALEVILNNLYNDYAIISTTGLTSREIFEIRKKNNQRHSSDFLNVGAMGHCTSIALGIALSKPEKKIISIDGDGALMMHMGAMATIGQNKPENFYHILINNEIHESVGGQKTAASSINLVQLAKSNGYANAFRVSNKTDLIKQFPEQIKNVGPTFIEIQVDPGYRTDLGRPTSTPKQNKIAFMDYLKQ